MSRTSDRVNALARRYHAEWYLELGTGSGNTFADVDMPWRTAVDEHFELECELLSHMEEGCAFFKGSTSDFFAMMGRDREMAERYGNRSGGGESAWDIIVLSGAERTFAAYWRDFNLTLPYSHAHTIWIMNYSVPAYEVVDSWAPDPPIILGDSRYGDVYKAVLAIHDCLPGFSYCTVAEKGYPQTWVWRADESGRAPAFPSLEAIDELTPEGLLGKAHLMVPCALAQAGRLIGMSVDPSELRDKKSAMRLVDADWEVSRLYNHFFWSNAVTLGFSLPK